MKKNKRKHQEFKKPFIVLNRRKIAGWVVAIFFLCAWMFVLGLLVGRDTAPVKFDIKKLQQIVEDSNTTAEVEEQSPTPKDSVAVKDKTTLGFYERLPGDQKDTSIPDLKPEKIVKQKIEDQPQTKDLESDQKSPAKKPETETAAKQSEEKTVATVTREKSPGPVYTIQAASVKNAKDADQLVARLKKEGYPAYRTIGKVPQKGIWFRVRIGEYNSKSEAAGTLSKLKKLGLKPILVRK